MNLLLISEENYFKTQQYWEKCFKAIGVIDVVSIIQPYSVIKSRPSLCTKSWKCTFFNILIFLAILSANVARMNCFEFIYKSKMAINRRQSAIVYKFFKHVRWSGVIMHANTKRFLLSYIFYVLSRRVSYIGIWYLKKAHLVIQRFPECMFFI